MVLEVSGQEVIIAFDFGLIAIVFGIAFCVYYYIERIGSTNKFDEK